MISDKNFADWHSDVFGYGYGSGEEHWLPALHTFFANLKEERSYDHETMEHILSPLAAWLLINTLCGADVIEYGTSPRYGWLTKRGEMIREYVLTREDLYETVMTFPSGRHCLPDWCNCENRKGTCNPLYAEGMDR